MNFGGPSDINHFVLGWVAKNAQLLKEKVFIELPAGDGGVISPAIAATGANLECYDLLPSKFAAPGISCRYADLNKDLPIEPEYADYILCQEGIEHIPNQFNLMLEFNKVLKPGGRLLITTPNYSNLLSRVSYLLSESERWKIMPPYVLDTVWFPDNSSDINSLYFGHVFLIGIQKMRFLAQLAGFEVCKIHHTKCSRSSLLLFPFLYPPICFANYFSRRRILRRNKSFPKKLLDVYNQCYKIGTDPRVLLDRSLFIEFEKVSEPIANLRDHFNYARPPA